MLDAASRRLDRVCASVSPRDMRQTLVSWAAVVNMLPVSKLSMPFLATQKSFLAAAGGQVTRPTASVALWLHSSDLAATTVASWLHG